MRGPRPESATQGQRQPAFAYSGVCAPCGHAPGCTKARGARDHQARTSPAGWHVGPGQTAPRLLGSPQVQRAGRARGGAGRADHARGSVLTPRRRAPEADRRAPLPGNTGAAGGDADSRHREVRGAALRPPARDALRGSRAPRHFFPFGPGARAREPALSLGSPRRAPDCGGPVRGLTGPALWLAAGHAPVLD